MSATFAEFFAGSMPFWGAFSIATATVLAVLLNYRNTKKTNQKALLRKSSSFSSALASELIDNSHNLMDLYFQLQNMSKKNVTVNYKKLSLSAYERLLDQIGDLGPDLSFMVVDAYGDIARLKSRLDIRTSKEIKEMLDDLLPDIQTVLIKATSASIVMYFYADYLCGKKWLKLIEKQRYLWFEQSLEEFMSYADKADVDTNFIDIESQHDKPRLQRIKHPEDKKHVQDIIKVYKTTFANIQHCDQWRAQLMLRAFYFKIKNRLGFILNAEADIYDQLSEKRFKEFLS